MTSIRISTLILILLCVSLVQAQVPQQGTAFSESGKNMVYLLGANNDLYGIKKSGTGSRSTEVHILASSSGYKNFRLQTGTPLEETNDNYDFLLAPNNDLVVIKKAATGTRSTEVHILSASSNYKTWGLNTGTGLHETDKNHSFLMDAERNLYVIKKQGTNSTEVHILSAASNYRQFVLQVGTALHKTDDTASFLLDSNRDLICLVRQRTGSGKTEVHVLTKASGYKAFGLQTGTALEMSGDNYQFQINPQNDIFGIKTALTGTKSTEVHVLSSVSKYTQFGFSKPNQSNPTGVNTGGAGMSSAPAAVQNQNATNSMQGQTQSGITTARSTTTGGAGSAAAALQTQKETNSLQGQIQSGIPAAQTGANTLAESLKAQLQENIAAWQRDLASGNYTDPNAGFMKQIQNEGERLALDVQSGKLTQEKAAQELNGKIVAHFSKQWMEQQKPMFESMKQQMKNDPTFPDTVKQEFIKGIDSFIQTNSEGNVNPQKIKEFNPDFARGVRIFEGEKLQGNSSAFGVGTFNANNGPLNGIGNDTAASVQVPAGYIVKLCSDEGDNRQGAGQCEEYREGTHNLKHPRTASWVNVRLIDLPQLPSPPPMIASSMPPVDVATQVFGEVGVKIFEGRDFQGKSALFGNGIFTADNGPINGIRNDAASSVIVPKGFRVKFCSDEGNNRQGTGNCEIHGEGKHNLRHQGQASWIRVLIE